MGTARRQSNNAPSKRCKIASPLNTEKPIKSCRSCQREFRTEQDFLAETSRWRVEPDADRIWFNCSCQSTLLVKRKDVAWYSVDKMMSKEASVVFHHFEIDRSLPCLSVESFNLEKVMLSESASAKKIAEVILREPTLAKEFLIMATSLVTDKQVKITSLEHAVGYLGLDYCYKIFQMVELKALKTNSKLFDAKKHWRSAIITGIAAREIGMACRFDMMPDLLFVIGSLLNVGKVVSAICLPKATDQIIASMRQHSVDWSTAEIMVNAPSHSILGEIAASYWALPYKAIDAIRYHHDEKAWQRLDHVLFGNIIMLASHINHLLSGETEGLDEKRVAQLKSKVPWKEDWLNAISDCYMKFEKG